MMATMDTIAAPASATSPAGVAVLRLSGPDALAIGGALAALAPAGLRHGHMRLRLLRDPDGEPIDRGYVVAFLAPRSFTGEDIVELHVHGSPAVVDRLMSACVALGARPAGPGEFSLRAFHNGKLDLVQAEALADLVSARSDAARALALGHLDGRLSRTLAALRAPLIDALAELEARLDFASEEDVGDLDRGALVASLRSVGGQMQALVGTARAGRLRLRGLRVALYGAPNAGKSTLFNALLQADRALVHAEPGTTRDLVEAPLELAGVAVTLVDTAGVRAGAAEVETAGIDRARQAAQAADIALWLRDHSAPDPALAPPGAPVTIALWTKADRPAHVEAAAERVLEATGGTAGPSPFAGAPLISALREADVAQVRALVAAAIRAQVAGPGRTDEVLLTRERHAGALHRAAEAVDRAILALHDDLPLEMCAADLRDAADALAEITGEIAPDDVLQAVFSRFCIGK